MIIYGDYQNAIPKMGAGKNEENEKMEEKGKVKGSKKSKSYYLTQHNFSPEHGYATIFFRKNP